MAVAWDSSDPDHGRRRRERRPVLQEDASEPVAVALERDDLGVGDHLDASHAVVGGDDLGQSRAGHAREHAVLALHHRDRQSCRARDGGHLEADVPAPDDDHRPAAGDGPVQLRRVVQRAQREHPGQRAAGHRQLARAGPGREHEDVVGQAPAGGRLHGLRSGVDRDHALVQRHRQRVLRVEARRSQPRVAVPVEELLRQRWAVIRQVALRANDHHLAGEARLPQHCHERPTGLTCADDHDAADGCDHRRASRIGSLRRPPTKLVWTTFRSPVTSSAASRGRSSSSMILSSCLARC
jgi:hypothetical protein